MTTNIPAVPSAPATPPAKRRGPPRAVEVVEVETLSPLMRRVHFGGAGLAGFDPGLPASYIKIVFPEPGQTEPVAPSPDGPRPLTRTYTPRSFDAATQTLAVDFVLHGTGPAANWAAQAAPGQRLLVMGPGPGYALDITTPRFLLVGDDSALPAIETILERLPAGCHADVVVEIADAREERLLTSPATLEVVWALRLGDADQAGTGLTAALAGRAPVAADTRIYLACEAAAMRNIKRWLLEQWAIPAGQITARGYWKRGDSNHPDHDYGE